MATSKRATAKGATKAPAKKAAPKKAAKKALTVPLAEYEKINDELLSTYVTVSDLKEQIETLKASSDAVVPVEQYNDVQTLLQQTGAQLDEASAMIKQQAEQISQLQAAASEAHAKVTSSELEKESLLQAHEEEKSGLQKLISHGNDTIKKVEEARDDWKNRAEKAEQDFLAYTASVRKHIKGLWSWLLSSKVRWIVALSIIAVIVLVAFLKGCKKQQAQTQKVKSETKVVEIQKQLSGLDSQRIYINYKIHLDSLKKNSLRDAVRDAENELERNNAQREKERISDKQKLENEKAAIRRAHTDAEIISTLANTARQQ